VPTLELHPRLARISWKAISSRLRLVPTLEQSEVLAPTRHAAAHHRSTHHAHHAGGGSRGAATWPRRATTRALTVLSARGKCPSTHPHAGRHTSGFERAVPSSQGEGAYAWLPHAYAHFCRVCRAFAACAVAACAVLQWAVPADTQGIFHPCPNPHARGERGVPTENTCRSSPQQRVASAMRHLGSVSPQLASLEACTRPK